MKAAVITIELPLPDDATLEDAEAMGKLVKRLLVTSNPISSTILGTPKLFGHVTKVKLK